MRISSLRTTYVATSLAVLICLGLLFTYAVHRKTAPLIYAAADATEAHEALSAIKEDGLSDKDLGTETSAHDPSDLKGAACTDQATQSTGHSTQGGRAEPQSTLIDINNATADELTLLPGVGPAYAERIIALREQRSGFVYKEELLDVAGIGPTRFAQLVDLVTVGPYHAPSGSAEDN